MGVNPKDAAINQQVQAWLQDRYVHGIDHSLPLNPLPMDAVVSSGFGSRNVRNAPGATHHHEAIDVVPANGQTNNVPVQAVVAGRILYVGEYNKASGYSIMIGGDNGKIYSYAHLQMGSEKVHVGQRVERAQPLAIMGNTGNVSVDPATHQKKHCVHVVERQIPLIYADGKPGDFDIWSWKQHKASGMHGASGDVFRAAMSHYMQSNGGQPIRMADFDKVPARFAWQENPRANSVIAANTAAQIHYNPSAAPTRVASAQAPSSTSKSWEWMSPSTWPVIKGFASAVGYLGSFFSSPVEAAPLQRGYHVTVPIPPARPAEPGHGLPAVPRGNAHQRH